MRSSLRRAAAGEGTEAHDLQPGEVFGACRSRRRRWGARSAVRRRGDVFLGACRRGRRRGSLQLYLLQAAWGATGQISCIWLGLWVSASGGAAQSASIFIQANMAQKPMLRGEVGARALRVRSDVSAAAGEGAEAHDLQPGEVVGACRRGRRRWGAGSAVRRRGDVFLGACRRRRRRGGLQLNKLRAAWGATGQLSGIWVGLWVGASGGAAQSASMSIFKWSCPYGRCAEA